MDFDSDEWIDFRKIREKKAAFPGVKERKRDLRKANGQSLIISIPMATGKVIINKCIADVSYRRHPGNFLLIIITLLFLTYGN
jgi:hypothetical protein